MEIINESVQMIHISPSTHLMPAQIQYALQTAASNFMYAKFYTDKWFIQVNFMKDRTINVASNIKLPQFVADLWRMENQGWTMATVKQFVYQWMQISRSVLPK